LQAKANFTFSNLRALLALNGKKTPSNFEFEGVFCDLARILSFFCVKAFIFLRLLENPTEQVANPKLNGL